MEKRFFEGVDPDLPDDECAAKFDEALERLGVADDEAGGELVLDVEDNAVLRDCAYKGGPKTRQKAIELLLLAGPCSWEDLEAWILDPEKDVRDEVPENLFWGMGEKLRESDKGRCVQMLSVALEKYPDDWVPIFQMERYAKEDAKWLELTWDAANRLLDLESEDLFTGLVVCYFEHVIPDMNWGPDDPHIRPWVQGADFMRQFVLLRVATWMGLKEGQLNAIVEALTQSCDSEIARLARGVMDGSIGYGQVMES